MFFDSMHPLVPYPNEVTFQSDLARRRDLLPNQEEWKSMVVSLVGSTVAAIPNLIEGMSRTELRDLAHECSRYCRDYLAKPCTQATIDRCMSLFFTIRHVRSG
jgi:hypothetical protein